MKNLWSLQVGEAVVAEKLSEELRNKGNYQVFIPLNNQLKDIDLILADLDKKTYATIQVKESRLYSQENKHYSDGKINWGWFQIRQNKLDDPKTKVDFYVFLLYSLRQTKTKYELQNEFIIVPSKTLIKKRKQTKTAGGTYTYNFEVKDGEASDIRVGKNKQSVSYSEYLNNFKQFEAHLKKSVKTQK